MSKHTPGPWAVEPRQWDHGASLAIVAPNNGYIVAIVPFDEDIQTVDEPDEETVMRHPDDVPNAALIAAAPELLEALKETLTYHPGVTHGRCGFCGHYGDDCRANIIKALINKAEGREV